MEKIGERDWGSWLELEMEYRAGLEMVKEARGRVPREEIADRQILGEMEKSTGKIARLLREKVRYARDVFSEEDLAFLTETQREIVHLRQRGCSVRRTAEMLGRSESTVYAVWQQAVARTRKATRQQAAGIPTGLSPQQGQIYTLWKQGLEKSQIAEELGIGQKVVGVQIRRIEEKIGA